MTNEQNNNGAKKETLHNLKNTYCQLRPSKIEGVGVFAVREIPKGNDPFLGIKQKQWIKFMTDDLKGIDKSIFNMIDNFFVIEKDDSVYIPKDGLNGIDVSFFVNNSKKPNLKIMGNGKESATQFIALRKIKKGEELTVSYGTYDYKYRPTD